jgi:hypothetical protein
MYTIYALVDPRDNIPRYVGLTDCPPFRLREHVRNLDGGKEKRAWVRELRQRGLTPSMEVLETTSTLESALQREKHWTSYYLALGMPLTNVQNTPYGNRVISPPGIQQGDPPHEWVTITEATQFFDVSANVISRMVANGEIQTRSNRRDKRIRLVSVSELRRANVQNRFAGNRTAASLTPRVQDQVAAWVTMAEAAQLYCVKAATIARLVAEGEIQARRSRRDKRIKLVNVSELQHYFTET